MNGRTSKDLGAKEVHLGRPWNEIPAGIVETAKNRLMHELGENAESVLMRLKDDPVYTRAAAMTLVSLAGSKKARHEITLMEIKQRLGSRCFLPSELRQMFGMTEDEEKLIPTPTQSQLRRLKSFLERPCPFLPHSKTADTHVLFPLPSVIKGITVGLNSMPQLAAKNPDVLMELTNVDDPFLNRTRMPEWYLMFFGSDNSHGVPGSESSNYVDQNAKLREKGYRIPDPTLTVFQLIIWHRRGGILGPHLLSNVVTHTNTSLEGTFNGEHRHLSGRVQVWRQHGSRIMIAPPFDRGETARARAVGAIRRLADLR